MSEGIEEALLKIVESMPGYVYNDVVREAAAEIANALYSIRDIIDERTRK